MNRVLKFQLVGLTSISLPPNARVLSVGVQNNEEFEPMGDEGGK